MELNNKNNSYNNHIVRIKKGISKKIIVIGGVIILSLSCITLPGCVKADTNNQPNSQVVEENTSIFKPMPIMPVGYPWVYDLTAKILTKILK